MAAVGILAWGGFAAFLSASPSPSAGSATTITKLKLKRDPAPLTNNELAVVLTRLGLAASPLAAAGCTGEQIGTVVGQARSYLQNHIQDLRDADQNWGTARNTLDGLRRLVQGGKRENAEAYQTAVTAFASADSARQTVITAIFNAAVDGLGENPLGAVQTIRGNASWDMPTQFQAANRSEANWVHLRNALANQRISVANGVDPDAGEQTFIASQSGGAVGTAIENLANLQALTAAWNAAVWP